jgi:hypothetical protein
MNDQRRFMMIRARYPRGVDELLQPRYADGQKAKEAAPQNPGGQVRGDGQRLSLEATKFFDLHSGRTPGFCNLPELCFPQLLV